MASLRLTKGVIDAAVPRTDKPNSDLYLWDSGKGSVSGFGLKVTPAGGKSFVFQYRMRGAKTDRRYKIGRFGDWTVDVARDRARELRRKVDAGVDPLDHDRAQSKAAEKAKRDAVERAFDVVVDRWLAAYRVELRQKGARKGRVRSDSTIQMVETAMNFLKKQFASKRIEEIDEADLGAAIDKLPPASAATRRNTFASARIFWNWAHRQRLVSDNPFERLEAPAAPQSRDRVLSDGELRTYWLASCQLPYPFGPSFRLLALTGQRRDEVTGMQWSELDRDSKTWRIASNRTKNGLTHVVPLSDSAIAVLDEFTPTSKWPGKGLVFTKTGKTPVSGHSGAKRRLDDEMAKIAASTRQDALEPWRIHDIRRTVATGLQRLGVRFEVTEAVMNHVSGARAGIAGIYQQHDWADEKRAALDAWAERLLGL